MNCREPLRDPGSRIEQARSLAERREIDRHTLAANRSEPRDGILIQRRRGLIAEELETSGRHAKAKPLREGSAIVLRVRAP